MSKKGRPQGDILNNEFPKCQSELKDIEIISIVPYSGESHILSHFSLIYNMLQNRLLYLYYTLQHCIERTTIV